MTEGQIEAESRCSAFAVGGHEGLNPDVRLSIGAEHVDFTSRATFDAYLELMLAAADRAWPQTRRDSE